MADLLEDASPLQIGAEGRYKNIHFGVIGRIQLQYAQGVWNEWFLLFDDQRNGWLSEASGNYVLSFQSGIETTLPPFEEISPGQHLTLNNRAFQVINKETATCIAGEGELPFKVGAGYPAPVVDLSSSTEFATIDYSDAQAMLFLGEEVDLPTLKMSGLREREALAKKTRLKSFNCPTCAAPLQIRAQGSEALACGSCGSLIDVSNDHFKLLSEYRGKLSAYTPLLPLGSRGRLRGADYDVVGLMRRRISVDGERYEWSEYLLYSEKENFRWLSEYQGHWNLIKPTTHTPAIASALSKPRARFLGRDFVHFQTANASVVYVVGEFYWRVELGEQAEIMDFVAPPLMLSREKTGKEINWSLGEYIQPDEIAAAFRPETALPSPDGVYANQPSPHGGEVKRYWKVFALLLQLAVVVQIAFIVAAQSRTVYQKSLDLSALGAGQSISTEPFQVDGHPSNLIIENLTNLNNNWLYLDMTLVEINTGVNYHMGREISYYHGYDGGESWSEGNARDEVVLSAIPAGNYLLQFEADLPPNTYAPPSDEVRIRRDVPGWSNFFLLITSILILPVIAWWRSAAFEQQRWAESDYAASGSDDSGDDGGDD